MCHRNVYREGGGDFIVPPNRGFHPRLYSVAPSGLNNAPQTMPTQTRIPRGAKGFVTARLQKG